MPNLSSFMSFYTIIFIIVIITFFLIVIIIITVIAIIICNFLVNNKISLYLLIDIEANIKLYLFYLVMAKIENNFF